jgi:hypothetical protein
MGNGTNKQLEAFVLMPFAPEFDKIYEKLIMPSLEDAGYVVRRADSLQHQQNIMRDIIKGIATADLIIAEVTLPNANVFYELGVSHGLRKPTILLTQSIDDLPFDLRGYRVQVYSTQFDEVDKLKEGLKKLGESHGRGEIEFGSPVIDYLPLDLEIISSPHLPEKKTEQNNSTDDLAEGGAGLLEASQSAQDLLAITTNLVPELNNSISRLNDHIAHFGDTTNAAQQNKIAMLIASELRTGSKFIEDALPNLDNTIEISSGFLTGYVLRRTSQDREELTGFRELISGLLTSFTPVIEVLKIRADKVRKYGDISSDVDTASRRMAKALYLLSSSFERLEGVCKRVIQIIDDKLSEAN